jgi:kynurenine formamidase
MKAIDLTQELTLKSTLATHLDFHSKRPESKLLATHIEGTLESSEHSSLVLDVVLLDLSHVGAKELIDDEDLEAAEEGAGLALREGEAVIIHTGWDGHSSSEEYWSDHPALSENGAEYLEFKRVGGVGMDTASVDLQENHTLPVHSILLRSGTFVLENICKLSQIDQSRFRLLVLPLGIRAPTSLVRAIALLDDTSKEY